MRVLHLSHTPLVGAPGRICAALNGLGGIEARWAVLHAENYGGLSFPLDWRWDTDREAILAFAAQADVLHLHNYIDLACTDFEPLDFAALWAAGKPMVRHFHSTPALVARYMGRTEADIHACPIPKIVIAQYPERFLPEARVVPNIVDIPPARQLHAHAPLRIGYAPSNFRSGRISRWDTKGYPETSRVLQRIVSTLRREGLAVELDMITQVPHAECLARKAVCDVFLDDLVTGSYHLNTLESLAQGSATLCHLDGRIQSVLADLLGRTDFPALAVRLEDIEPVLRRFARDPALARALGAQSRTWMQSHWQPAQMAARFVALYADLVTAPRTAFAPRFGAQDGYRVREFYDDVWQARHAQWPPLPPEWLQQTKARVGGALRKLGLRR